MTHRPILTADQKGALWMCASMAGFALEDAGLKLLARQIPLGQILILQGLAGLAWFAFAARHTPLPRQALGRGLLLRSAFELAGRLFYALAVVFAPISLASAILQATPLVVVPVAARLFGERVGTRRTLAILGGFLGVIIVLRPTAMDPAAILAVLGMLGFAGRDLATRAAPPALTNAQLGMAGFGVLTLSGLLILLASGRVPVLPGGPGALLWAGLTAAGLFGYAALTRAMRTGAVAAVTPFRYSRLVFAMVAAILVFGERPDLPMILGAALIVAYGILALTARPGAIRG